MTEERSPTLNWTPSTFLPTPTTAIGTAPSRRTHNGGTNIRNSCKTLYLPTIPSSTTSWHGGILLRASNLFSDAICDLLADMQLDAGQRKLIGPDGKRLELDQSVARIHRQNPDLRRDWIEYFLIDWIETDYAPEHYSKTQLDELDRLTPRLIADHSRRVSTTKKQAKLVTHERCTQNHKNIAETSSIIERNETTHVRVTFSRSASVRTIGGSSQSPARTANTKTHLGRQARGPKSMQRPTLQPPKEATDSMRGFRFFRSKAP